MPTEREPGPNSIAAESRISPEHVFCSLDEQRQATRFRREDGTDFAVIWRERGEEILVEVHDESLNGLGILVDKTLDLELGSCVHVVYAGEYLEGEVRHITKQSTDKKLIGLRCQRVLPSEAD